MRIALFSWESVHSVYVGGVAIHVTELACALERKGHEVHVFTRLGRPDHPNYERIHGVHYHRCPFSSHHNFIEEINNMCRAFVNTVFYTEDHHSGPFDIIHAHDWLTVKALQWIKDGRGRKSIVTVHSTEYGRCGNNFYSGPSATIRHHEWLGTFCADRVIAVSHALKNEIKWIYSTPDNKINVIYNGVNYKNYDGPVNPGGVKRRYEIDPMAPMVLFAGRMVYQKGPDILLETIPHILRYYPHAKFVFAGDGGMRAGMEDQARRTGIGHAVRFLGHHGGRWLVELYRASDCVCVPSRNEPFGIVILEAWSSRKPVVVSVNGGPAEIVNHNVNGLKTYAYCDSVAWGLGTLLSNFDHARWMGENGRQVAEISFSWNTIAEEVLAVYNQGY